jgi:hypothetical protein
MRVRVRFALIVPALLSAAFGETFGIPLGIPP